MYFLSSRGLYSLSHYVFPVIWGHYVSAYLNSYLLVGSNTLEIIVPGSPILFLFGNIFNSGKFDNERFNTNLCGKIYDYYKEIYNENKRNNDNLLTKSNEKTKIITNSNDKTKIITKSNDDLNLHENRNINAT